MKSQEDGEWEEVKNWKEEEGDDEGEGKVCLRWRYSLKKGMKYALVLPA